MKKLLCLLLIAVSLLAFTGCGDKSGIPEGMQLVGGGDGAGYHFFAPEEWIAENLGEIDIVYVSRVDTTSVSFTEIDPQAFVKPDPAKSDTEFFLNDYFNSVKSEFPSDTKFTTYGAATILGTRETKADGAVKYVYTYSYNGHRFGFIQILAHNAGRYYILTYSASLDKPKSGDTSKYDYHMQSFQKIVDNFRFSDKVTKKPEPTYSKDADGDILATDKKLAGFSLYLPEEFKVDYSSAIVSATHSDGSNVTMTKATATGMNIGDYWQLRKKELSSIVTEIKEVNIIKSTSLGNSKSAAAYEYTYVYNGETFHVYQIFAIHGATRFSQKGYVFTYTATDDNFDLHFEEINRIIKKVQF
jgi:hypothetical protein